jgi:hypothetical protein
MHIKISHVGIVDAIESVFFPAPDNKVKSFVVILKVDITGSDIIAELHIRTVDAINFDKNLNGFLVIKFLKCSIPFNIFV